MRNKIIDVLKKHFESHILKHKMNVDIMMNNPIAIHDHTDLMSAIEIEIALIAEYQDKLDIMEEHFKEIQ